MDALKITEAHIIGNSLGAHIAVIMAIMAPKRIQSLTLIAQPNFVEVCVGACADYPSLTTFVS